MAARAILLLTLVSALLVACGGDERLSRGDYEREMKAINVERDERLRPLGQKILKMRTGEDTARVLEEMQEVFADAAEKTDELKPPRDVEGAHARLVAARRQLAGELDDLADRARETGVAPVVDFDALAGAIEANRATLDIESRGYRIRSRR